MRKDPRKQQLRRRRFDRRLEAIRDASEIMDPAPPGWIATIREALGMSRGELGRRLGVSRQAVSQLEAREADGSITLNALRQAASALGARVVYAVVPDEPITTTLEARAHEVARRIVTGVDPSKRLADPWGEEVRIAQLAEELLDTPQRLWPSTPAATPPASAPAATLRSHPRRTAPHPSSP